MKTKHVNPIGLVVLHSFSIVVFAFSLFATTVDVFNKLDTSGIVMTFIRIVCMVVIAYSSIVLISLAKDKNKRKK
jgi:hypothetical protein